MSIKLVTLCALLPAVFTTSGISINDMFPYGSNNGDSANTYHGSIVAQHLDWYELEDVPSNLPSVKWGGRDLGRRAYVSVFCKGFYMISIHLSSSKSYYFSHRLL